MSQNTRSGELLYKFYYVLTIPTYHDLNQSFQAKLRKQDQKYELLKAHAEEKLEEANKEIETTSRSQDAEVAKLTAMLKKTEMKAASLERTVEQRTRENQELTNICDDLIAKVGT